MKGLRGGALDVFGKTEERRAERALITDYERMLDEVVAQLDASNHAAAVQLACVPDEIRGYGHVKEKSMAQAELLRAQRLQTFRTRRVEVLPQSSPASQPQSVTA